MQRAPYREHRPLLLWCAAMLLPFLAIAHPAAQAASRNGDAPAASGTVRDESGAVVSRATIVIQQESSGLQQIVDVLSNGSFSIQRPTSGLYTVKVSAAGFATATRRLELPAATALTFTLVPAPIVEQVTVVSASRQGELRDALNTAVDVIGRSRIEDSGSQTVGELLRELPGVLSRRNSEGAGTAGEQIQGLDSRQVLVLLDGQPLVGARGIKSGVLNLDRQSAARLERVEVVKGAASALYGSDAIGGVINLISRDVAGPIGSSGELSGGALGELNTVADIGGRRGHWSGLAVGERHRQDGFDLTPTTFDTTAAPFSRYDYLGRVRGQLTSSLAASTVVHGYTTHFAGRSSGELGPQENDVDERTLNVNLAVDWAPAAATAVQARAYTARYDEQSAGRLAPPASTPLDPGQLNEQLLKIDSSFSQVIGTRQQLQAGAEFWRDEYSGLNRLRTDGGERATTRVGWAQYRASVSERVVATIGARVDHHSAFGAAFSPKAAVNARVGDGIHLRASVGRGFRAPDLGQLYYRFLNPSNLYQVIGNPALTPEYGTSIQVGAEFTTPGRQARIGVNAFRNDVRDLINSVNLGFVATPSQLTDLMAREGLDASFRPVVGRLFFTYRNVSDAVTSGVELDGEWAIRRGLSMGAAYTHLDARDDITGLSLTGRHPHQGHARLTWASERLGLRANVRGAFYSAWVASRTTVGGVPQDTVSPAFALWDAYLSQRIVRNLSAFVAVDNLTNSQDPNTGTLAANGSAATLYRLDAGCIARLGVRWSWTR